MPELNNGNGQKIKLYERVATLEQCHKDLAEDVNEIKTNHLPHLQKAVDKISEKFDRLIWFFVVTIVGLAVNILLGLVGK